MRKDDQSKQSALSPSATVAGSVLIVPTEDDVRNVKWWQYVNQYGTHMTKVVDRATGNSVMSNQYGVGGLATYDLDKLVTLLRSQAPKRRG
jgi:hypothetical protein